ncbi:MAG: alpha/beta fold hydrolase, partial [Acidimicrobiia bacterium]|nr:alpha/beta fold hydrolase [Acidimicrobiia bacterium]
MTSITDTAVPIAWEEQGDGPPLLLVQGLGYGRWGWQPLVPLLYGTFRVITFDNRGIGESAVPAGPYTAAQMAMDCVSVLDAAGVESAHVVGTSLGGMVAQELAIDHPERVRRLTLLSTTPGGAGAHPMPQATVDLLGQTASMDPVDALRLLVENALSADASSDVVDEIMRHRVEEPQDPAGWQSQAAAGLTYDGAGRAASIRAETLIMHGQEDNVVDYRNADVLGELINNSRVRIVPGGHLFFWEYPEGAAEAIISF